MIGSALSSGLIFARKRPVLLALTGIRNTLTSFTAATTSREDVNHAGATMIGQKVRPGANAGSWSRYRADAQGGLPMTLDRQSRCVGTPGDRRQQA